MNTKLLLIPLVAIAVLPGCGASEDTKPPTKQEIKSFVGTPLTPEQVARLRGGASSSKIQGPNTAAPGTGRATGR